jgi:nucleoside-diphosphate-sugar epimerase
MKTALVCGAGGFIGSHLVKRLKREGSWVRGVDLKFPPYAQTQADDFVIGDLREQSIVRRVVDQQFDEVYQLAADMGGAGYVFTGENDADIMHNSALINLNIVEACYKKNVKKVFYSSSACIYPEHNQTNPNNLTTAEHTVYPANPDSEYGWEKLFSEHLYLSFRKNHGLDVRIARFHNIYGPEGSWDDGREKAPAAFCRKVAVAQDGDSIEMWGNGEQLRSFLYIDECLEGVRKLMDSKDFFGPVNIGSDEMISINDLAEMIMDIANKKSAINHIPGPLGVIARNSDNKLIKEMLNWAPDYPLQKGMEITYKWINEQLQLKR